MSHAMDSVRWWEEPALSFVGPALAAEPLQDGYNGRCVPWPGHKGRPYKFKVLGGVY